MLTKFAGLWNYATSALWTVNTTPTKFNGWEHSQNGPGVEADHNFGHIRIEQPGTYIAYAFLSFIGTTGDTYFVEFRENGNVGAGFRACVDGITGGVSHVSLMGAANVDPGDVIEMYIYSDNAGGSNFTLVDGQFGLFSM